MKFVPMKAEHAMLLDVINGVAEEITPEIAVNMEECGGVSAIDDDGNVVAICGILPKWEGTGVAWAWLTRDWRRNARKITEEVHRHLDNCELKRIELAVKVGFEGGYKWAERLGFTVETPVAKNWGPDSGDYRVYVRCK